MRCLFMLIFVSASLTLSSSTFADDHCQNPIGINLAGPEFGKTTPGRLGYDYFFPTEEEIIYFKKLGFRSIRLPIMWERLQPQLDGPLDKLYLAGITLVLDMAAKEDMSVVVDLHNYGRYRDHVVGSSEVPINALYDVWQKLAGELKNYKALHAYGLMNEPYDTSGTWPRSAQSGIDAIRSVDPYHEIYVSVENSGDSRIWKSDFLPFVKDPMNLEVYEAHIYFDADYSGRYDATEPRKDPKALVEEGVAPFIAWLKNHGKKGVIGEWGVPSQDERWFPAVDRMVEIARQNCLPIYYWAGGNWGPDYKLSLGSGKGDEKLLAVHFKHVLL